MLYVETTMVEWMKRDFKMAKKKTKTKQKNNKPKRNANVSHCVQRRVRNRTHFSGGDTRTGHVSKEELSSAVKCICAHFCRLYWNGLFLPVCPSAHSDLW